MDLVQELILVQESILFTFLEIVKMKLMESIEVMFKKYLHMTLVSLLWIMEA